jgi:hypothetical protein
MSTDDHVFDVTVCILCAETHLCYLRKLSLEPFFNALG